MSIKLKINGKEEVFDKKTTVLNLIKDRLREHACVINGIIKELSKEKKE